jgi:RNA polymerase sigma-70 factor, ECF subfamily
MTTSTTLEATQSRSSSTAAPVVTSDGHTWDDLARSHWSRLVGYARKKGCSDPEAVAGEVLADAFAARNRFTGTSHEFGKWLYTIAFRRISDTQRRWYASPEVLTDSPADTAASPVVASPDVAYDEREAAISAFSALEILSDRDRQIIEARVIDEQPVKVVAQRLGLSPGAVRVYQSRALNKLRAHLDRLPSLGGGLLVLRWPSSRQRGRFAYWLSEASSAGTFTAGARAAAVAAGAASASTVSAGSVAGLAVGLVAVTFTAVTATPAGAPETDSPAPAVRAETTPSAGTAHTTSGVPYPLPESDVSTRNSSTSGHTIPGPTMPSVSSAVDTTLEAVWHEFAEEFLPNDRADLADDTLEGSSDTVDSAIADGTETTEETVSSLTELDGPTTDGQTTEDDNAEELPTSEQLSPSDPVPPLLADGTID